MTPALHPDLPCTLYILLYVLFLLSLFLLFFGDLNSFLCLREHLLHHEGAVILATAGINVSSSYQQNLPSTNLAGQATHSFCVFAKERAVNFSPPLPPTFFLQHLHIPVQTSSSTPYLHCLERRQHIRSKLWVLPVSTTAGSPLLYQLTLSPQRSTSGPILAT